MQGAGRDGGAAEIQQRLGDAGVVEARGGRAGRGGRPQEREDGEAGAARGMGAQRRHLLVSCSSFVVPRSGKRTS